MKTLLERYRFFREHAGYIVGRRAECALALARAEETAQRLGLTVTWDVEDLPWDGDCEPPPVHARATVIHPMFSDVDTTSTRVMFPFFDRRDGSRGRVPEVLAALGSIGLSSWHDPYMRVVEAELFSEALGELDKEWQAEADELAERPTLAGVSP